MLRVQTNAPGGKLEYTRAERTRAFQLGTMTAGIGLLVGMLLGVGLKAAEGEIFGYGAPRTPVHDLFPALIAAGVAGFVTVLTLAVLLVYRATRPRSTRYVGSEGLLIVEKGRRTLLLFAQLGSVDLRMRRELIQSGPMDPRYTGTTYQLTCADLRGMPVYRIDGVFNDQLPLDAVDPVGFALDAARAFETWRASAGRAAS